MPKKPNYSLLLWSGLIFLFCLGLMFIAVSRETAYIESNQISMPSFSGGSGGLPTGKGLSNISESIVAETVLPPVLYILAMAAFLGIILFFIPKKQLSLALRILFGVAFSWGTFIFLALLLPTILAGITAIGAGVMWLMRPTIYLHNVLLALMLVSLSSVFGAMFSPWTIILIMLVVSIYDFLAVRVGYMQWMAQKLSESETLPAFFIPHRISGWKNNVNGQDVKELFEDKVDKQLSIMGGGDVFFPLILAASVFFAIGIAKATVVGGFSLLGLISAYVIHFSFMKHKATPALPPIFAASFCGLLLVHFALSG